MSEHREAGQEQPPSHDYEKMRVAYEQIASLAGGLAHELRNPLSTITLNLAVLREDLQREASIVAPRILSRLDVISQQCEHLEALLADFLDFARGLELELEPVAVNRLLAVFLQQQKRYLTEHNIQLCTHLAAELPDIMADRHQLECVFQNLLINASQAMPQGGNLEWLTYREGNEIIVEVIDSGCGISLAQMGRIFDLFYTTKKHGSGLGLPTVKKIVEAHGGDISCQSTPEKGTRFRIQLPILRN